ncbi:MAG: hypothetical protein V3T83_21815, partial [Acidobacteriota bacterium]
MLKKQTPQSIIEGKVPEAAGRAVEREHFYEDVVLGIHFENPQGAAELRELIKRLLGLNYIRQVGQPQGYDLLIRQEKGFFVTEAGEPTEISPRVPVADEGAIDHVVEQVEKWARWFGILSVDNSGTSLAIEFDIEKPSGQGREIPKTPRELDLILYEGEEFDVRVTNKSSQSLFVTLLDVSNDGSIEVVFPRYRANEYLASGRSLSRRLKTNLPKGRDSIRDVLKVIATTEETDFSFLRQEAIRDPSKIQTLNPLPQIDAGLKGGQI